MAVAAVILARGGSKGIPRKNIQQISGKPLVTWAIEACLQAEEVDSVFVSTEDAEIADVARLAGASIINRPAELAADTTTSNEALHHAALEIGDVYDIIVNVECTVLPQNHRDIDATIRAIREMDADSAMTVKKHVVFLWRERPDGFAFPVNQYEQSRRQDAASEYALTGAAFAVRREAFLRTRQLVNGRIALVKTFGWKVDIDTPEDLQYARTRME
jgi:CMP-N-acetylneuraminic acid synthetase